MERPTHPRTRWAVYAAVAAIVIARSGVFVFWDQSFFDSNQAVIGLMAKHLIEGRAFPVFMYGQGYMLAVESWLAAPLFLVAGPSVTALKLPLLGVNLAIAWLLVWFLQRETRLGPVFAGLASLFFVLPPAGTAAQLLEASGGIVEPLLYVLLLWLTRRRPVWCGIVLGFGFVHREFTMYGFLGLLILDAAHGAPWTRDRFMRIAVTVASAAAVWLAIAVAKQYGSAMGPGTTIADLPNGRNDIVELLSRFCFRWSTIPIGSWRILTVHWPLLFGTAAQPLRMFDIESGVTQGVDGLGFVLGAAMLLAGGRIASHIAAERRWREEYDFVAYLIVVTVLSVLGYAIARCGVITLNRMRYDLLSILGAVGLAAWYLRIERSGRWKAVWIVLLLCWAGVGAVGHGRLWLEYLRRAPTGGKQRIVRQLDARGFRYGIAAYRDAYVISFLTNERIIVMASDRTRIRGYQREVARHRRDAVRIMRRPCRGGELVEPGIYFCPPERVRRQNRTPAARVSTASAARTSPSS